MINIAIIEDDIGLNNGIALALKKENYKFAQYFSLTEAEAAQLHSNADLIILDINLRMEMVLTIYENCVSTLLFRSSF